MHVEMKYGLPCGCSDVDADVVSRRFVVSLDLLVSGVDPGKQFSSFFWRGFEPRCNMAPRDEQCVSETHREHIPDPQSQLTLVKDSTVVRSTERTGGLEVFQPGAPGVPVSRVTTRSPASPAAWQAAQRQL